MIVCQNCKRPYPETGAPHKCPTCGGLYDWDAPLAFDPAQVDESQPGLWRYRHTFGLPLSLAPVTLGEGLTPLLWIEAFGRQIAVKSEYLNPTGSFKDRAMTVLVSFLKSRGVNEALEDSSGNAGASFAAYAARAGMKAGVYVPAAASGPKIEQIKMYGAEMFPIAGARADVTRALESRLKQVGQDTILSYASHAWQPYAIPGYATVAYEIFQQIGGVPGAVIVPVGQGGLYLGLVRGFDALKKSKVTTSTPKMIGVQPRACAPLWVMSTMGAAAMGFVTDNPTIAEGIRIRAPLRGDALLRTTASGHGAFVAVEEQDILPGRDELSKRGLYVEPTSAVVWDALRQTMAQLPDPIVLMLTGSGYKFNAR